MNITPQQIVQIARKAGENTAYIAFDITLTVPWMALAFDLSEFEVLAPTREALREKLGVALAQNVRRYISELDDTSLNELIENVMAKEIRNEQDKVLLTEAGIDAHAIGWCEAHGVRLEQAQEEEIAGMWDWLDDRGNAGGRSFDTEEEAALDAIEQLGLTGPTAPKAKGRRGRK